MDTLEFSSDPSLKAVFHSRRYDESGWLDSFIVEVGATDFHASTRVENPGYGHPPSKLFEELALSWKGWTGTKVWVAMEGELELKANCDSVGHVIVTVSIPAYASARKWSSQAYVPIEAGQLERVAREAKLFFERRDA